MHVFFVLLGMEDFVKPNQTPKQNKVQRMFHLQVSRGWSNFGFVRKHQCFKSEADSYRKPGAETAR